MEAQEGNNAEGGGGGIDYPKPQQRHGQFPSGLQWPQLLPICGNSSESVQPSLFYHFFSGRLGAVLLN